MTAGSGDPGARAANAERAAERLRAEFDAAQTDERRARLVYETGEVQERAGHDGAALASYFAAADLDRAFVEPLESALRIVDRTAARSEQGRVLERLARASTSARERARALTELGLHHAFDRNDWPAAKESLLAASEIDIDATDSASVWLALEIVAAKLNDKSLRARALAERGKHPSDPRWQALVRFDALREAAFDPGAWSIELEREGVGFTVAREIDRLGAREPAARPLLARALRVQETLIARVLDVPAQRAALGVPPWLADLGHLADARLRLSRVQNDDVAAALLSDTLDRLRVRISADVEREGHSRLAGAERAVGYALLARLARAGKMDEVGSLAQILLTGEARPEERALLQLKLAEVAAERSDAQQALGWLSQARREGAPAAVAAAVEYDLLGALPDVTPLTTRLRELAEASDVDAAKVRHLTLAAYLHITRDRNVTEALQAWERIPASASGVFDTVQSLRVQRMLFALGGSVERYENATIALSRLPRSVLAHKWERASLAFEALRAPALRGDGALTKAALRQLSETEETQTLFRLLTVFAPFSKPTPTDIRALADHGPKRTALLAAAMRAIAENDSAAAEDHLRSTFREDPSDPLAAALLAATLRRRRAFGDAGDVAAQTAETTLDDAFAAATHLAAALDYTQGHRGRDAMAELAKADARKPGSAVLLRGWVARFLHGAGHEGDAWPASLWAIERIDEGLRGKNEASRTRGIRVLTEDEDRRTAQAGHLLDAVTTADDAQMSAALDGLARLAGDDAQVASRIGTVRAQRRATGRFTLEATERWAKSPGAQPAARLAWLVAARANNRADAAREAMEALAGDLHDDARDAVLGHAAVLADDAEGVPEATGAGPRLARLEIVSPDSPGREAALAQLGNALGESAGAEALGLAAVRMLARGDDKTALVVLRAAVAVHPDDMHLWELLRIAARKANEEELLAHACTRMAELVKGADLAARLYEHAALAHLRARDTEQAEKALFACLERDPSRVRAFEFLFRRLRDRKDHARALPLLEQQIPRTDDADALARLYWEKARSLRDMGNMDAALDALSHVTTLDPDHVGALALTSEAHVKRGEFAQAAELLARLAGLPNAPPRNRVTAGVAAAELFETRLGATDRARDVLVSLYDAGFMSLPLKERLAKVAALSNDWPRAAHMLGALTDERATPEGRLEAGKLALAIARDKMQDAALTAELAQKLLGLDPSEAHALDVVLTTSGTIDAPKRETLARAETALVSRLGKERPAFADVERIVRIARALGHNVLERAGVSTLGVLDPTQAEHLRPPPREEPSRVLDASGLRALLAPGDEGPFADLFVEMAGVLSEAFSPPLAALGVGKRDRVDSRSNLPIRDEIGSWVGAFGVTHFELYVGGGDPNAIACAPGEPPRVVIGAGVRAPLDAQARGVLARGLLATLRGTHVVMTRDDDTLRSIFEVVCRAAKVHGAPPSGHARLTAEVERLLTKHINRRVRAAVEGHCKRAVEAAQSGRDIVTWGKAARLSLARAEVVGSGDVAGATSRMVGVTPDHLNAALLDDDRVLALVRFALSNDYLAARTALGLGKTS